MHGPGCLGLRRKVQPEGSCFEGGGLHGGATQAIFVGCCTACLGAITVSRTALRPRLPAMPGRLQAGPGPGLLNAHGPAPCDRYAAAAQRWTLAVCAMATTRILDATASVSLT